MAARANETLQDNTAGIRGALAVDVSGQNVDLPSVSRGIYLGVAGNLAVIFGNDGDNASVTLTGLAAGVWHPMQVRRVLQTGTTASGIVAGF